MSWRRNFARTLAAAFLLAVAAALLLLPSAPGHAQTTERQLLSNIDGNSLGNLILGVFIKQSAQPFETGKNSTGYTLTKIQIKGSGGGCTTPSPDTITVTLRADSSGEPADTALATFNPPGTWALSGLNDFTLTKVYELDPVTTYHIHIVTTVETCLGRRAASRVDANGAPDWSFSTRTVLNTDGDWEARTDAIAMRLRGAITPLPVERQLLSNTDGNRLGNLILGVFIKQSAQPFETGKNSTGYTLTKIQIKGSGGGCTTPSPDTITVTLRADSSGEPADTALATFNPPGTWALSGLNDFTLTKVYELDPVTTYHIHIVTTVETCLGRRAASRVDANGAPDWSFSTRTVLNTDGDWEARTDAIAMRLRGAITPLPVERQLLSNTDGTSIGNLVLGIFTGAKTVAQPFRTGQNSPGYTLTKMQIQGRGAACTTPSTDTITVTLRADSSGEPADTALATFNPPGTWALNGLNNFALTKVYELDPVTTYHIHIVTTVETCLGRRAADRVDSGSAPGWSFSTRTTLNTDGDWEARTDAIAMRLRGAITLRPATGAPTISGTAEVGQTLTAATSGIMDADGLASPGYTYQWIRVDGATESDISGATSNTYTLVDADVGKTIKVKVSFTDDASNDETLTSAATAAVTAAAPTTYISNINQGNDSNYQTTQLRAQSFTTGSQAGGYTVTHVDIGSDDDQGDSFSAAIYTTNSSGHPVSEVAALTPPSSFAAGALTFTAPANTTLAASTTYSVRIVNSSSSDPARLDTTTSNDEDADAASGWSIGDNAHQKTSPTSGSWTAHIASIRIAIKGRTPATGAPTISGTAEVGQTLTAATSGIMDADGLTTPGYTYQWIRVDGSTESDISGATSSTYTLVDADEGKTIKVKVSFTDDGSTSETLTSAATAAVLPRSVYVSNMGQTAHSADQTVVNAGRPYAQPFDTGSTSGGYPLGSIAIIPAQGTVPSDLVVTIRAADSNDLPSSTVLATLTNPVSITSGTKAVFPAPSNITLAADVTYFVHFDAGSSTTFNVKRLPDDTTTVDSGGATGWSIGQLHVFSDFNSMFSVSFAAASIKLEVSATGANTPATGAPTISGTAQVGQTLTAATGDIMDSDGLTTPGYTYQWVRVDGSTEADISGATSITYTLVAADEGKTIKVKVSFTDGASNAETLTSAATATVQTGSVVWEATLTAPAAWGSNGTTYEGYGSSASPIITANHGTLTPDSFTLNSTTHTVEVLAYQTTQTLLQMFFLTDTVLTTADLVGFELRITVDGATKTLEVSSASNLVGGGTTYGIYWDPADHGYSSDDWAGKTITVLLWSPNNPATGAPTISGTAQVGETLTAATGDIMDADGLTSPTYTYQWVRVDGNTESDIPGATSSDYTLVAADEGKTIKVRVSFTDAASHAETLTSAATSAVAAAPNNPATGAPTISGTAQVGETLTAATSGIMDTDGLSGVSYTYQWIRVNGTEADISGATSSAYTLVAADEGKTIKVKVSFTDDASHAETLTSAATAAVAAAPNNPATGAPTISGTAQVGETLTAATSGIMDTDGLTSVSYTYQWVRVNGTEADISGATASTYTLVAADEGKTIKVKVSFTDDAGNSETLTSAATVAVAAAPNNPATGAPTISGTAQVGETLTAATSGIMDTDGLTNVSYTYQWVRVDGTEADISGATSSTYTLVAADEGKTIKVKVSFTDDAGNAETLTSAATATVNTTYISNLGQADDSKDDSSLVRAQPFTTGSQTGGYTVTHVDIGSDDDEGDSFSAAIYTVDSDGYPDSEFAVLIPPSSFAKGALTFTAPANTVLAAGTTYTVRIVKSSGVTSLKLDTTVSNSEDSGGAAGWSIGNAGHHRLSDGSWSELAGAASIRIAVKYTPPAANNAATGAPTISGTATVGETLTAATSGIADTDGLTGPPFVYRWVRVDGNTESDIPGATASTYTLVAADEGKTIKVRVSFTDDAGNPETLTSAATAAVAAEDCADDFTTTCSVSPGTSVTGDIETFEDQDLFRLSVTSGVTYQIDAEGSPTSMGTLGDPYLILVDSSNTQIDADDDGGAGLNARIVWTASSTETVYIFVSSARIGQTGTYTLTVTITNYAATGAPTISGTAQVGEELTAATSGIMDTDGLSGVSYTYQWIRVNGTEADISGATSSAYTLVAADEGKTIKVKVSFTDDGNTAETRTSAATVTVTSAANNVATGAPTISGTAQVGETLTAATGDIMDTDGLSGVSYTYQWVRVNGTEADISGATASTYTLVAADEGKTIKVKVSFTDDAGNSETLTSAATSAVAAAPNNPATGAPAISGTAQVGETLTAATSGIMDTDGLSGVSYTYQWVRVNGNTESDIPGATSSAYTLVAADAGKTIKVKVSFTDDAGYAETLTSAATSAVAAADCAGDTTTTCSVSLGGSVTGDIELVADRDYFSLSVTSGASYRIDAEGSETNMGTLGDPYLVLRDASDTELVNNDDGGTGRNARIVWVAGSTGTVYVEVKAFQNSTGTYTLTVSVGPEDDCANDTTTACSVSPGTPVTGDIQYSGDDDYFSFSVASGVTYQIDAEGLPTSMGTLGDSYIELRDASGAIIAENDIGGTGYNARLTWTASDTLTVYVAIRSGEGGTGTYTLTVTATSTPATGAPTISGTAQVGETLTADTGDIMDTDGLSGVSYTYQWIRVNGTESDISGATSSTYTPVAADLGKTIKVKVSFTDDNSNAETLTSAATTAVAAANTAPDAPGAPRVAVSATDVRAITVEWDEPANNGAAITDYDVQYQRDDETVWHNASHTGTGRTVTISNLLLGYGYRVQVRATNSAGTSAWSASGSGATESNTAATGKPTISGTLLVGETLTVDTSGITDADGLSGVSYAYQWRRDGTDITGANSMTYTLAVADAGAAISVEVSFTDDGSFDEVLTSDATTTVAAANNPATGAPTISGTAQVGETLTATTSGIMDSDGLATPGYTYQWIRVDSGTEADISGATSSTYTLVAADEGKTIKVKVSFTDDNSNPETLTSAATATVAADLPGAPLNLSATAGDAAVMFTWGEPPGNGAPITAYRIRYKVGAATAWEDWVTVTTLSATVTGLTNDTSYDFEVQAQNSAGWSASAEVSATPVAAAVITTYISNIDQGSREDYNTALPRAQSFTTGSQTGGYAVTSVDIRSQDTQNDRFSAAIYTTNASGHPDSEFAALTPPASFARGTLTFTAPANTTLAASTTYTVRITVAGSSIVKLGATTSNAEDNGGASGWSIGNVAHSFSGGSWSANTASRAIRIAIKGSTTVVAANTPATGAPTISGTAQVGETLTAATSGIMDSDGLTSPTYAYQWVRVNGTEADISGATSSTYTLVDADEGKTIKVKVSFTDDNSNPETLTSAATGTVLDVPGAPTGLSAAEGSGEVTLSWTAPTDTGGSTITGYNIQQDGTWDTELITGTSHTVTGLTNGTAYTFRVRAVNAVGAGQESASVSATPQNSAPTFAQQDYALSVAENSAGGANVGSPVTATDPEGDTLRYALSGTDANRFTIDANGQISTASGTSLDHEATASFTLTITASDGNGGSDTATVNISVSDVAEPPVAPGAPTVTAAAGSGTSLDVTWSAPGNAGKPAITGYDVRYRKQGETSWSDASHTGTGTTASISGLTSGTGYEVQVRAKNDEGDGGWSATGTGTTTNSAPAFTDASVTRSLDETTGDGTLSAAADVGAALPTATDADGDSLTYSLSGSDKFTLSADRIIRTVAGQGYDHEATASYTLTLTAEDGKGGAGTLSVTVNVADVAEPPVAPAAPTVTAAGLTSVQVSWSAPGNVGKPAITGYDVQYRKQGETSWSDASHTGTGTTASITGLETGTTYEAQVRAKNDEGDGAWSSTGSGSTGANNPATGVPVISGTAQVGETLTAGTTGIADSDGLGSFSYQWKADGTDIAGATSSTYTLTDAEQGKQITVTVSFTDGAGTSESVTSAATSAVAAAPNSAATGAPTITGTAQVGETLTAATSGIMDTDGLTNVSYTYQWVRVDGSTEADISGATASIYTLVAADEGKTIKVKVSFTDDGNTAETRTSAATVAVTAAPNNPATGAPTISGTAQVGETLTAATSGIMDTDGLTTATYTYQWVRVNGTEADISGATASTYTLVAADEGKTIKVKVSFTDDAGNSETLTSAATVAVAAAPNNPATGAPTINGTAVVGEPMRAATSGIMDTDGLTSVSYTYQWVRVDGTEADISGATSSTYTLVAADEGKTIKVKVSFTDDAGNAETLTSAATVAVANAQTTTNTYVSNIDQGSDNDWSASEDRAQTFTTGSRTGGYTVTSVDVGYEDDEGDKFSAAIWTVDSDNEPDDGDNNNKVADLTAPTGTWSAGDTLTFTAPTGTTLDASTTYAVVLTKTGNAVKLDTTTSSDEDSGAFAGWSIADGGYFYSSNTWTAHPTGEALRIAIKGTTAADDCAGDTTTTCSVSLGGSVTGDIEAVADRDYFSLAVTSGASYQIDAEGSETSMGTLDDPHLILRDASDTNLDLNDDGGDGVNARIVWTASSTGTVYVLVSQAFHSSTGTYTLTVSVGPEDDCADNTTTTCYVSPGSPATGDIQYGGDEDYFSLSVTSGFTYQIDAEGADTSMGTLTDPFIFLRDASNVGLASNDDGGTSFNARLTWTASSTGNVYVNIYSAEADDTGTYTLTVSVSNTPATGAPAITGTTTVGEMLTATTGSIADADGLTSPTYTYQWIRVDGSTETDISGATASTYTLVAADLGKTIKVKVSFTDDDSNAETLTSAATSAVTSAANNPATGAPTISGTAQVGQTLSASTSGISDTDGLNTPGYSYQWVRVDGSTEADISGATSSTYTLVAADEGKTIKVKVSFTDDASNAETLTSMATAAVAAAGTSAVNLSATDVPVDEGERVTWTVALATQPTGTVTVTPVSDDTGAVTVRPLRLYFTTSNWDTPQTVTATALQDADGVAETVTVSHPASGGGYGAVTAGDVTVRVDDDETPTAPGMVENLRFNTSAERSLSVVWDPPANDGRAPITNYRYTRGSGWVMTGSADIRSGSFTGLTNGNSYDVIVQARNTVGWGPSATVRGTASTETPDRVGVTSDYIWDADTQRGRLDLIWAPPVNPGWGELTYRVEMAAGEAQIGPYVDGVGSGFGWQVLATAHPGRPAAPSRCPIVWRLEGQPCVIYSVQNAADNTDYAFRVRPENTRTGPWDLMFTSVRDLEPHVVNDNPLGVDYRIETNRSGDRIYLIYTHPIRTVDTDGYRVHRSHQGGFGSHAEYANAVGFFVDSDGNGDFDWSGNLASYGEAPERVTRRGRTVTLWLDPPIDPMDDPYVAAVRGAVVGSNGLPSPALNPMGHVKNKVRVGTPPAPVMKWRYANPPQGQGQLIHVQWSLPTRGSFPDSWAEGEGWEDHYGSPDGYEVEWSADRGTTWQAVDPPHEGVEKIYAHGGLTVEEDSTFHYRVRGVNGSGEGPWSNVLGPWPPPTQEQQAGEAWTEDLSPGLQPRDLEADPTAAGNVLSWRAPWRSPEDVTGYQILRRRVDTSEQPWPIVEDTGNTGATWTDTGVEEGVLYFYQVKTVRGRELSRASNYVEVYAVAVAALPGAPGYPVAESPGAARIDLTWTAPAGDPPPLGYEVQWSADGESGWQAVDPPHAGTETAYADTGLSGGTTRHYRVRAIADDSEGPWSAVVFATTEVPLTASFSADFSAHGGAGTTFVVRLTFSEAVAAGYRTLRDTAVQAENGEVRSVSRVNGSSAEWDITVAPASDQKVLVTLSPGEGACGESGVICTADGRKLSNYAVWVVLSPPAANTPATGVPTIGGTARVGQTLTADTSGIADADGLDNVSFSYQWQADGAETQDATDATYTPVVDDVGKAMSVTVSFTDDAGNEEESTSAATDAVETGTEEAKAANSPATGAPAVTGAARVGETLAADTSGIADEDGLTNATFAYQWLAGGADISGATDSTYVPVFDDAGRAIGVRVSFTDDAGFEETLSGAAVAVPADDYTVNEIWETGNWGRVTVGGSATGVIEKPGDRDFFGVNLSRGRTYRIDVAGHGDVGALEQVRLYGVFVYAEDLECSGAYDDPGVTTYVLTAEHSAPHSVAVRAEGDGTGVYRVSVSESDDTGTGCDTAPVAAAQAANTPATGAPAITGTAQVGETLTADTFGIADEDGLDNARFAYQWLADGADISGATSDTYTLADADEGKAISVKVSFTDDAGNEETLTSAATDAVEAKPNTPATGAPATSGTARVGETLTADTSGIADADGLSNASFAYQWLADGAEISGATDSTYTLADADEGKAISVTVSFTDDRGHGEEQASAATAAVAGLPPPRLTASLENVATSHDGESVFTFELRFSEEFGLSYKTLRDHAFTVTGGTVKKAQRLEQGSNIGWRITVRPNGNGDVTVFLPVTTDCEAQGAICTGDGRMLSHRLELTVAGPGQ